MIRVVFSNRTELLLDLLIKDLTRFRRDPGPWEAPNLVFPHPGMRDFVYKGIAQSELRVCANIQANYMEGFWRGLIPIREPQLRLLDRAAMQGLLLGLLKEGPLLAEKIMAPVASYLAGEPRDTKALQLAEALARVFEAYLLGRPNWITSWEDPKKGLVHAPMGPYAIEAEQALAGMEAWQRRLWRALREKLAQAADPWVTLPELIKKFNAGELVIPKEVFFFGLGPFAQTYHQALASLGEVCQVTVYTTAPCRHLWEDLKASWQSHCEEEDPFSTETKAHLALQRWGKPGLEQFCQLCGLTDWNVDEVYSKWKENERSLLRQLQEEILTLEGGAFGSHPITCDGSLQILACPSPQREAEEVANEIWNVVLASHGSTRFSDIAVMLPEGTQEDYLDSLRVAFAETRQIPWCLTDRGPGLLQESADAATQLLKLGLTDLNRAQVIKTLSHPAIQSRWPDLPLEHLPEFCERAGIIARMDEAETSETYLEEGLWTWNRGFQRMAIGHFSGNEGSLDWSGRPLPAAVPMDEGLDLALMLQALLHDLRHLRITTQGPKAWANEFSTYLNTYLGGSAGRASEAENRVMTSLTKALGRMEALEVTGLQPPQLAYREAVALAQACFERLVNDALGPFGRGVSVASHAALRGIPFKVVFAMGMGEGVFPGSNGKDPMDLRVKRKAGDLSRLEQDQYLFLETLISVRERLFLSYSAKDSVSGEALEASSVIQDLRDILSPALAKAGWADLLDRRPPLSELAGLLVPVLGRKKWEALLEGNSRVEDLRDLLLPVLEKQGWQALHRHHRPYRHDLAYFPEFGSNLGTFPPNHNPAAKAEAEALWLGEKLRFAANACTELDGTIAHWSLSPDAASTLEGMVQFCGPLKPKNTSKPAATALGTEAVTIRAGDLRKWLECQIQGGAKLRLHLREEDDFDPADVAEEPFAMAFLDRRSAMRGAFWEGLAPGKDGAEIFRDKISALREAARSPVGLLAEGEIKTALEQIEGWKGLFPEKASPSIHCFGKDRSTQKQAMDINYHDPVVVKLANGKPTILIEGKTEPQWEGRSLLLSERSVIGEGDPPSIKDRKDLLRAWFDQLLLAAAGIKVGEHEVQVLTWKKGEGQIRVTQLPAITQQEAKDQLANWIGEALGQPRWALMPIEAVLDLWEKPARTEAGGDAALMEDWLDKQEDGDRSSFSSMYGSLPRAPSAPVEAEWRKLAVARFGNFPAWSLKWEG